MALREKDPGAVQREVDKLMPLAEERAYRHYIEDRRRRYRKVMEQIAAREISDLKQQAIVVWNAGLFFECHDLLEGLWIRARGKERKALQGLIQAAGVFVHRQPGRDQAANKLSYRAVRLIEEYRGELAFIENIKDLIVALKQNGAEAPELKGKNQHEHYRQP
jgi:RNase P subunit RPR2